MKPTQNSKSRILVFGAHPDDIEFGCGGIIASETQRGAEAHFVVCSRGETASNGTPEERERESREAAKLLGASIEFIELDGDAHLETKVSHAVVLAELIRKFRPTTVLAPSLVANQHPDHSRLAELVRNAARLARYGGLSELQGVQSHSIDQLFYYAITPEGEPADSTPTLFDISAPDVVSAWLAAMNAHNTQSSTRNYVDLQTARARVLGERCGVQYAMAIWSNDPLVVESLAEAGRGARRY